MNNIGVNGASHTYNNASKLLAAANEIDSNASDYGINNKQAKNADTSAAHLMLTLSEDNELQAPDGHPMTSVFDQLEEM